MPLIIYMLNDKPSSSDSSVWILRLYLGAESPKVLAFIKCQGESLIKLQEKQEIKQNDIQLKIHGYTTPPWH